MIPARCLALLGFMGSGKTTVGRRVAELSGALFDDLDHIIESAQGHDIATIFETGGEPAFRQLESSVLPQALAPGTVLALGGGATISSDNWRLIRERSLTVFLDVPFSELWSRLEGEIDVRPLLRGRSRAEIEELYRSRRTRYLEADRVIEASRPPDEIAREVTRLWSP